MLIVYFYTTSGCHLCEKAAALLNEMDEFTHFQLNMCDISESDALVERYGIKIPVLQRDDTKAELNWPFDKESLERFLG